MPENGLHFQCGHALRFKDMLPDIRDALESSTEEFAVHLEELEMTDTMTEKLFN